LPHISDFALLIDLFLQILEDVRIDVSRRLWLSHGGVHHTSKVGEKRSEARKCFTVASSDVNA
jgi:hypothetical protein